MTSAIDWLDNPGDRLGSRRPCMCHNFPRYVDAGP